MLRRILDRIFGWDEAEETERDRMWRGIVVRSNGSAYVTNERLNEMVQAYLAKQRRSATPSDAQEKKT